MNKPEVLAPAGSMEALKAAIDIGGADAVYVGGDMFGARAYAANFSHDELLEAIDYVHLRGRKLYLTVNTLLKDKEMPLLYNYLKDAYTHGLDACIVQDFGVLTYLKKQFPDMAIHASTQMTICHSQGVKALYDYGVSRVVPARELSLLELSTMKNENKDMELEVFVHGAFCYCYSGQCQMSSMIGGRSGNRGRCAQPCRLPYSLYENENKLSRSDAAYLLSPKDLCGLHSVKELIECGIDSFKIEGRMKSPLYVAYVTKAYRYAVDSYFNNTYDEKKINRYIEELMDIYNRGGFHSGYYHTYHGKSMMSLRQPNHIGYQVGTICKVSTHSILVNLCSDVTKQDVFTFVFDKDKTIVLTGTKDLKAGETLELNVPNSKIFRVNMPVYRTKNQALNQRFLEDQSHPTTEKIKGYVCAKQGKPLLFSLKYKEKEITVTGDLLMRAENKPVTKEMIFNQFNKLGNTIYQFEELIVDVDPDCFLPVGSMKKLRRDGIDALMRQILAEYERPNVDEYDFDAIHLLGRNQEELNQRIREDSNECHKEDSLNHGMSAMVTTKRQLDVIEKQDEISRVFIDFHEINEDHELYVAHTLDTQGSHMEKKNAKEYVLCMPRVFRERQKKQFMKEFDQCINAEAILVRTFDELAFLIECSYKGKIYLDSSVYAYNKFTRKAYVSYIFNELGVDNITFIAPAELTKSELSNLVEDGYQTILMSYGYQPLMISAQCLRDNIDKGGCDKKKANQSDLYLVDRKNHKMPVKTVCKYCYNVIYNDVATYISDQMKKDRTLGKMEELYAFLSEDEDEVIRLIKGRGKMAEDLLGNRFTRGHYKREVE